LRKIFSTLVFFLFLAACSQVFSSVKTPVLPTQTISIDAIPTPTAANGLIETPASLNAAETVIPSTEAAPVERNVECVIPPQFDPNGTPAGEMSKRAYRLLEDEHPGTPLMGAPKPRRAMAA
jgi:hypothetical protein